jgi:hypothetical protein
MRTNDASANANPTLEANNDHRQRQIGYGAIAEGMSADPSLSMSGLTAFSEPYRVQGFS